MATIVEQREESLSRAVSGQSVSNYPAIFDGFMARGIPESEIRPRENVFSYRAWQALGRQVRRGEKGVRVSTWVERLNESTGKTYRFPRTAVVFHVSQTDPIE